MWKPSSIYAHIDRPTYEKANPSAISVMLRVCCIVSIRMYEQCYALLCFECVSKYVSGVLNYHIISVLCVSI